MQVDVVLRDFVEREVLAGSVSQVGGVWQTLERLLRQFSPANEQLLAKRDTLQQHIDRFYQHNKHSLPDADFFRKIEYLAPEPPAFCIAPERPFAIDPEIASTGAPQLVVPVDNARFLVNAANARWGVLGPTLRAAGIADYDELAFLNEFAPVKGRWSADSRGRLVKEGWALKERLATTETTMIGVTSSAEKGLVLRHRGLHFIVYEKHIEVEAACTTIVDFEDSVAAVDAADKVRGYRNWMLLLRGELAADGKKMRADIEYRTSACEPAWLKGRSLLLNRNVGLHMKNPMVRLNGGRDETFEGICDAFLTVLIASLHDKIKNSRNIYIVKPKLHGPEEVKFTVALFAAIERELGLPENIVKLGIMDEERRTSVNLRACLFEARERVIFINTGFLDRTGDELHSCGRPVARKAELKTASGWFEAYEARNVAIALATGFSGKAQVGKGMWAEPDKLKAMFAEKIAHVQAGATTAWVPSPAAAVIHAIHYHRIDVLGPVHAAMRKTAISSVDEWKLKELLTPPLLKTTPTAQEIAEELTNNAQSMLGYVVRWIDAGVGCSKIPDIRNVGLMEDRATLRISSQHMANWLKHGLVTKAQIHATFRAVAALVDKQNANTPNYHTMSANFDENFAVQCALELVMNGDKAPNGYVAPTLSKWRRLKKARSSKL